MCWTGGQNSHVFRNGDRVSAPRRLEAVTSVPGSEDAFVSVDNLSPVKIAVASARGIWYLTPNRARRPR